MTQILLLIGLLTATAAPADAPPDLAVPAPGQRVVIGPITQPHPRLILSRAQLAQAKLRFESDQQPWREAADRLREDMQRALQREGVVTRLEAEHDQGQFYRRMESDAQAMVDLALGYWMTSDDRYAAKAVELLRQMSDVDLHDKQDHPGRGMVQARGSLPMALAYDLLYDHPLITPDDHRKFDAWFMGLVEEYKAGMKLWDDNDYFNHQDWQNHVAAHTMGMLVTGYLLGDRELAQFAVDHPDNPRDLMEMIQGAILMPGDKPHHREPGDFPIHPGEIYDRYRHFTAADPDHPAGKGLQYAYLTLSLLTVQAEVLYNNGINLYAYTAPGSENLEAPFAFYSDFYRTGDSSLHGGFYAGEDQRIGKTGDSPGLFEVAACRYPGNAAIRACVEANRLNSYSRSHLLGHATLLWGVSFQD